MWTAETRARYDRSGLRYPSDLTDAEWALIAPMIPPAKRGGRKREVDVREVVNGLLYVLETVPLAPSAQGLSAEEHGAWLLRSLGLGRHVGAHPRGALPGAAREGGSGGEPVGGDHRQPERQID